MLKSRPLLKKSIMCGLVYIVFPFLIIFFVYIIDLFEITIVLGAVYGIVLTMVAYCVTLDQTLDAMLFGILSAFVTQILLSISGVPYRVILYLFRRRRDGFVLETGRLSVNEVISYNFGTMFFWFGLIATFAASLFIVLIIHAVKKRRSNLDVERPPEA